MIYNDESHTLAIEEFRKEEGSGISEERKRFTRNLSADEGIDCKEGLIDISGVIELVFSLLELASKIHSLSIVFSLVRNHSS